MPSVGWFGGAIRSLELLRFAGFAIYHGRGPASYPTTRLWAVFVLTSVWRHFWAIINSDIASKQTMATLSFVQIGRLVIWLHAAPQYSIVCVTTRRIWSVLGLGLFLQIQFVGMDRPRLLPLPCHIRMWLLPHAAGVAMPMPGIFLDQSFRVTINTVFAWPQ